AANSAAPPGLTSCPAGRSTVSLLPARKNVRNYQSRIGSDEPWNGVETMPRAVNSKLKSGRAVDRAIEILQFFSAGKPSISVIELRKKIRLALRSLGAFGCPRLSDGCRGADYLAPA